MALTERQAEQVGVIGFHWEGAYTVDHDGERFTAARLGEPEHVLTAETATELRQAIRSDYFAWMATLKERMSC